MTLEQVTQSIADALQPLTSQIPELLVVPRAMPQATPPCIDIYPAREFQRGAGMGVGNTRVWFTVRARVNANDDIAANSLLLRLLDPNGPDSVEAALVDAEAVLDNDQGLITGFEVFPDSGGDLLGCTWTVGVFL